MAKEYWQLLRDPRWQRKRLEVMERDNFACMECGDKGQTLNVHHCYYERGLMPWEYSAAVLKTLCEPCHEKVSEYIQLIKKAIGTLPLEYLKRVAEDVRFVLTVQVPQKPTPATEKILEELRQVDAMRATSDERWAEAVKHLRKLQSQG